ncbi:MAG: ABC transporter ATP-binding protein [Anaerolineaceae bacterium]
MLIVDQIHVYYNAIHAVKGISFELKEGEVVALIGANGAGKSSTLNTISGLNQPREGHIHFDGDEITAAAPQSIVERHIIQVPEGRKIFPKMTVMENLEIGAYSCSDRNQIRRDMDEMMQRFPRLGERRKQLGGTLSGGEQQMLAMARGLMAHPRLLLLDEPSMGLSPVAVEQVFDMIREFNQNGLSILMVEQNAQMALSIADRGYVLETGKITLSGTGKELLENPRVREAYLGG